MSGATWDKRKPGDWLASNGRWYPASDRPRSWKTLALPPAPGHGGVSSLHRTTSNSTSTATLRTASAESQASSGSGRWANDDDQPSTAPAPPVIPRPRKSSAKGRPVADATASNVRTYKHRLPKGQSVPPGLPPASEWRDDTSSEDDDGDAPPPPPGRVAPTTQGQARSTTSAAVNAAANASYGDLGSVLGKARKKIEDAINEAAEGR